MFCCLLRRIGGIWSKGKFVSILIVSCFLANAFKAIHLPLGEALPTSHKFLKLYNNVHFDGIAFLC